MDSDEDVTYGPHQGYLPCLVMFIIPEKIGLKLLLIKCFVPFKIRGDSSSYTGIFKNFSNSSYMSPDCL